MPFHQGVTTVNLQEQLRRLRAQLSERLAARQTATDHLTALRADSTTTEDQARAAVSARSEIDAEIDTLTARESELVSEIERDDAMGRLAQRVTPAAPGTDVRTGQAGVLPGTGTNIRVGQEPRAYSRESDPSGRVFLRDVGLRHAFQGGARESNERLDRHMAEVRVEQGQYLQRAAGTGAFAGLVVPQYLTEAYAPLARAMRPFADACNHHDLPPDGMTLNISRITTGTSAALQASENTGVSNTDIDDTLLPISVQTNAGQQTLSRQAVERGTGTEDVTVQDLFRAYATTLDNTLINQATTGLAASATTQTYTDASPTGPEQYAQIIKAQSGVESIMLNMASGDNIAVMHSRRWYGLQSSMSAAFPMISQPGMNGAAGVNLAETYGSGARGRLPNGTPVIVDNNIVTNLGASTNQDEIYVADRMECHLWEDPNAPVFIRAEQPAAASLGILFVLYGYFAYTFGRYPGQNQKITGTGLTPPLFDGS
jgi:hypothetical protein